MAVAALAGLDLLATAIVIVDRELVVRYANPAAENLFELSSKSLVGNTITETFEHDRVLGAAIDYARTNNCSYTEHDLKIGVPGHAKLHLSCTLSPIEIESWVAGWQGLLLEFRHIEQQIKMNSIVGPFDYIGNGQAVPDGVLRTWIDGVLVDEHTALRWRRHPEMGVQGPLVNWFYGGKQPSEVNMHYRMNHFVVARQYIGPRPGSV